MMPIVQECVEYKLLLVVGVLVDADHEHGGIGRGGSDDDLLGTIGGCGYHEATSLNSVYLCINVQCIE